MHNGVLRCIYEVHQDLERKKDPQDNEKGNSGDPNKILGEQQKEMLEKEGSSIFFDYAKTGVFKSMLENPQSLKAQETHIKINSLNPHYLFASLSAVQR